MDATYAFRQALLTKLQSGQWRAGDRLPTERDFCEQFRISRTTVRKVLGEFRESGWLHQTVGSGTYVSEQAPFPTAELTPSHVGQITSPAELMQARLVLEPAIIELVIGNATVSDLDRLETCCAKAEVATSHREFEKWDGLFHDAIAQAAHNSIVSGLFRLMNDARSHGEWGMLKERSLTDERRLTYQREHRDLLEALRRRDPVSARNVLTSHLLGVRRNLLNY